MRLWSLHPKYLDSVGLVALWRESLLAQKVLYGETTGYRNHPQLTRFVNAPAKLVAISAYLWSIYLEAKDRKYNFNSDKIRCTPFPVRIPVTRGQLQYELNHLLAKLKKRDTARFEQVRALTENICEPNPVFYVIDGAVESWERIRNKNEESK